MSVTIVSTDSPEVVAQAMGQKVEPKEAQAKEAVTEEVEAATEEVSEEVEAKGESEESAESDESEVETEVVEKPKKKSGFAKKLERKDAEIEQLRSQLAANQQKATETPKETKAEGKPNMDDYATHSDYVEALTDWKLEQKEKERETKIAQAKVQEEQRAKATTFKGRLDEFAEKNEDFYEVIESVDEYQLSGAAHDFLLESELAAEVMYKLAQTPKEVARIHKLSPARQVAELGIFEAKLAAEKESKKETKKITSTSKPLTPVGSKGKAVEKSIYTPGLSFKEYEALRAKELAKQK